MNQKAYLDTCIISAFVKGDLKPDDVEALPAITALASSGEVTTSEWIDEDTLASSDSDRDYKGLLSVLPDEIDAKHLALAKLNGISTFITADEKTILKHALSSCLISVSRSSHHSSSSTNGLPHEPGSRPCDPTSVLLLPDQPHKPAGGDRHTPIELLVQGFGGSGVPLLAN